MREPHGWNGDKKLLKDPLRQIQSTMNMGPVPFAKRIGITYPTLRKIYINLDGPINWVNYAKIQKFILKNTINE